MTFAVICRALLQNMSFIWLNLKTGTSCTNSMLLTSNPPFCKQKSHLIFHLWYCVLSGLYSCCKIFWKLQFRKLKSIITSFFKFYLPLQVQSFVPHPSWSWTNSTIRHWTVLKNCQPTVYLSIKTSPLTHNSSHTLLKKAS